MLLLCVAASAWAEPAPAWNVNAKQFIFAPAFELKPIDGASAYRFTIAGKSFEAASPCVDLTPIWSEIPVGTAHLKVEGINAKGEVVGVAGERTFHRAAPFKGPYGKPVVPYAQSARIAIDTVLAEPFVRSWGATGKPDPSYSLYRYASKTFSAVMSAASMYARRQPRPSDADDILAIGRAAGDYLITISKPAGEPLEFFPPTYHNATPTQRENDNWTMLISPAEAGQGYLDLYDVTQDKKYLDAAKRIAATYAKTQLPGGTWHLKVDNRTGEPIAPIELIPSAVIGFLDRVKQQDATGEPAVRWMMENPVRTFDWKAQFDDAKVRGPYENLSKHEATAFAGYLFQHGDAATGLNLLRFAEDQFVIWEHPPDLKQRSENLKPDKWFTPCSTEQYAMFEPISGSSAFMIVAYVRAYEATGEKIHLAKAESLANALTLAQSHHRGRYPTRMVKDDLSYWINSTVNTAKAMQMLADVKR
jgi:maltose/maltodextrin transport system substrate-binding protein